MQRRSFGFVGPEGALFDESNQVPNSLSQLITNESIGGMRQPQNYIQRSGGQRIDLGPSMQEVNFGGIPNIRDQAGNMTSYTYSGQPVTMSAQELAGYKAQGERQRMFKQLQDEAMLRDMQMKAGRIQDEKPSDRLAREKFEWEKTRAGDAGPKLTEGQAKATTFASQMAAASN